MVVEVVEEEGPIRLEAEDAARGGLPLMEVAALTFVNSRGGYLKAYST